MEIDKHGSQSSHSSNIFLKIKPVNIIPGDSVNVEGDHPMFIVNIDPPEIPIVVLDIAHDDPPTIKPRRHSTSVIPPSSNKKIDE
jgi:hypothetical protein